MSLPGPPGAVWDGLAEQARNVFATRAWAECWTAHYGEGSRTLVVTAPPAPGPRSGGPHTEDPPATGLVAVSAGGRLLRRLRLVGAGPGDQLGVVGPPAAVEPTLRALAGALDRRAPAADVLVAHDVPVAERWAEHLRGTVLRTTPSPVVHLPGGTWDDYLAGRSRNLREQVRRKERNLRAGFSVTVRLADRATLDRDLTTLFELHRRRWGPRAAFATGRERRFQAAFAARALAAGWLRLWVLELDGHPVAALHGFRFAGVECFHQSGRDPDFDRHSVGFLLLAHALRAAQADGVTEYRLLRGDEGYKARFADGARDVCTVAVPLTARGRLAVRAAVARRAS